MSAEELKPPAGIPSEIVAAALAAPAGGPTDEDLGCDAYALWAAMTRLAHEVKLQGRAFAALREQIGRDAGNRGQEAAGPGLEAKVSAAVGQALTGLKDEAERKAEAAERKAERAEEDLLATLTDVHDRLARSLEASRRNVAGPAARTGFLSRFLSPKAGTAEGGLLKGVESLIEGQELALRRVGDELAGRGLREIRVLGLPFNPDTMRAVAAEASGAAEDGTVTAVVRGGWMLDDTVWRVAEVVVARNKRP